MNCPPGSFVQIRVFFYVGALKSCVSCFQQPATFCWSCVLFLLGSIENVEKCTEKVHKNAKIILRSLPHDKFLKKSWYLKLLVICSKRSETNPNKFCCYLRLLLTLFTTFPTPTGATGGPELLTSWTLSLSLSLSLFLSL